MGDGAKRMVTRELYLVNINKDDLVWIIQVDLVLLANQARHLINDLVALDVAVGTDRGPDRILSHTTFFSIRSSFK